MCLMPVALEYLWHEAPVVLKARLFVVFIPDNGSFWFPVLEKNSSFTQLVTQKYRHGQPSLFFIYLLCI